MMYSAIEVAQCGGPEVLKIVQKALPTALKPTEILVKVKACGVNPVDTYIRTGGQGYNPSLPYVPGNDLAGEVEQVGSDVKQFKPGSRVYAVKAPFSQGTHSGGYAQYCVMDSVMGHLLPNNVTYEQGASIGTPYYTAYKALFLKGYAKPGDTVLVHGASGGVGLAACQLAKSRGLRVFGTAGTSEGMEVVRESGAHRVFNHRKEGYVQEIKDACPEGMNIILEMLANANLQRDLDLVAQMGKILIIGSRSNIEITPRMLMTKDCSIAGVRYASTTQAEYQEMNDFLYVGLEQGWLKPVVDRVLPLERAPQAHTEIIQSSGAKGNIVLNP